MGVVFERFDEKHKAEVTAIFNYYVETSTAAFVQERVPQAFFDLVFEDLQGYPAYALVEGGQVIGFCFLSAYHPMPTFRSTATISYFISPDHTGRGLGKQCLEKLEQQAKRMDICHIIAEISEENKASLKFHEKNGFKTCGTLQNIGHKMNRDFSVVLMQKDI